MSNHAHVVCKPLLQANGDYSSMSRVMHSLKLHTALESNKMLGRTGEFWQHENYDHVVRDEAEWRRIVHHVVNNPVSAGLVEHAKDWKWTYCKYDLDV